MTDQQVEELEEREGANEKRRRKRDGEQPSGKTYDDRKKSHWELVLPSNK